MKCGFLLKFLRLAGSAFYRIHVRGVHVMLLAGLFTLVIGGLLSVDFAQLRVAAADAGRLEAQRRDEQGKLDAMERQAQTLQRQNAESERRIEAIGRALGTRVKSPAARVEEHAMLERDRSSVAGLGRHLERLAGLSARTRLRTARLSRLAGRVLNLRHLASIARYRMLAAIPSLNPVGGAINAAFGYRTNPFPEFHKGLDLAAAYGAPVHAAAAGVVASSGWDGGFGIKVDIDHGNGYHTWYCHLSRASVRPGDAIRKGDEIAAVGSTGESTGAHLHYQLMHDGVAVDPLPFLNGIPANVLATLPADSSVQ